MASLINIALTGLQASQTSLNTTGNNVSNANTPGYSRQQVNTSSAPTLPTGNGYVGSGVKIDNIQRLNSEFANTQLRSDTALFNQQDTLSTNLQQVDNLLGNSDTGLSSAISSFFGSLQGFNDPSSIPKRQQVLSQADALVSQFHSLSNALASQQQAVDQQISNNVSQINSLAKGIAQLNASIASAQGAGQGQMPNDLLDQRDEKLRQLSELVQVKTVDEGNNTVNVMIGNGQALVVGDKATSLAMTNSAENAAQKDISIVGPGGTQDITGQLTGGKLGGILDFRDQTLTPAFSQLGKVAIGLAYNMNKQSHLGMDLQGTLGGNFFNDVNDPQVAAQRILPNANNAKPDDRVLRADITDPGGLTGDNYQLKFDGATNQDYSITDTATGKVVQQGQLPGVLPTKVQLPGFSLTMTSGSFQKGDSFLIRPTYNGAANINRQVNSVDQLALAQPIRAQADAGNQGSAAIDQGTMLNVVNPLTNKPLPEFSVPGQLSPPLEIRFTSANTYDVLDASDPANPKALNPPMNNLSYQPGITNKIFTSDPGQTVASMQGLALNTVGAVVPSTNPDNNGYGGQTVTVSSRDPNTGQVTQQTVTIPGPQSAENTAKQLNAVNGINATAYTGVKLSGFSGGGGSPTLNVNGETFTFSAPDTFSPDSFVNAINNDATLQNQGITAVSDGSSLTLKSTTGADITVGVGGGSGSVAVQKLNPYDGSLYPPSATTVSNGQKQTIGGNVDITLDNGVSISANNDNLFNQTPVATSSYMGFQFQMAGPAEAGDTFQIQYNKDGSSDNRNAVALGNIASQKGLDAGSNTLSDSYAQLVESVGTKASQSKIDQSSSQTLLTQSTNQWQSVSGVNLDEEAGKMIQYQAAYNASAQMVKTAQQLLGTLLAAFQ